MSSAPGEGFKDKTKEEISKQKFLSIAVDNKSGLCLRLRKTPTVQVSSQKGFPRKVVGA